MNKTEIGGLSLRWVSYEKKLKELFFKKKKRNGYLAEIQITGPKIAQKT